MIGLEIPGFGAVTLEHCVADFSGTLSRDGRLIDGVRERVERLSEMLEFHVLTSDTHGRARLALEGVRGSLHVLQGERHELQKQQYVARLGAANVVALGNGNNDVSMLLAARLGIAVCHAEGLLGRGRQRRGHPRDLPPRRARSAAAPETPDRDAAALTLRRRGREVPRPRGQRLGGHPGGPAIFLDDPAGPR